jgi:hypothetical protein
VISTARISCEQPAVRETLSGSANWAFDNGTRLVFDPRAGTTSRSLYQLARLAFLLAVSSVSSGPDPWAETRQQGSRLTMTSTFQTSGRRRISLREALRLADEIMRRAEEGRTRAAEEEASRQFDPEGLT